MRPTYQPPLAKAILALLALAILAAPLPAAGQVTVDPNALNALGAGALPAPPPPATGGGARRSFRHHLPHLARADRTRRGKSATAVAAKAPAAAGAVALEHPKNLGSSFASLPPLPKAAPPLPPPPPVLAVAAPKVKPAAPKPTLETAQAPPAVLPVPPQLALPVAAPPPPPAPARMAETTPAPPAAASTAPPPAPAPAPAALPPGADRLTLPFSVLQSDLPSAENAMLRDFAQRYGPDADYVIRAFASAPAGDDDPSTPRRISLARAQSVSSALLQAGAQPGHVRILALGDAGGTPANRVDVIAMPPPSGHTASQSPP
jgi:hypothetical protein